MANKKLTDLPELLTPADDDWLYVVDKSDLTESPQGTSKKIKKVNTFSNDASKEDVVNKSNSYTVSSSTTYASTKALVDGLATKQPLNSNLTSVSSLSYVSPAFVKMTGLNTFTLDTNSYYLSTNPSGYTSNNGTVTSVSALTLGTTGTDLNSSVSNGTTTPVITLNVPTASATNRGALSSTDWSTFNGKQNAIGYTPANDANVVHLEGTELISGAKTFSNTSIFSGDILSNFSNTSVFNSTTVASVRLNNSLLGASTLDFGANLNTSLSYRIGVDTDGLFKIGYATETTRFTYNKGTGILTTSGFVKSGGLSTEYLKADGSVSTLTNPITGTGTNGYVSFWNGTNTQSADSNFFWDNTNKRLGIGTPSPTQKLDVNGNIRLSASDSRAIGGDVNGRFITGNSDFTSYINFWGSSSSTAKVIELNSGDYISFNSGSSFLERMRITSGGNALIGTTTDDGVTKLQVNGSAKISGTTGELLRVTRTGGADWAIELGGGNDIYFKNKQSATTPFSIVSGVAKISNLSGTGTRTVVADASGNLSAGSINGWTDYTPTISLTTNLTSVGITTGGFRYKVDGNIVTVTGNISANITTANTAASYTITLPVNRALTTSTNIGIVSAAHTDGTGRVSAGVSVTNATNGTSVYFYPIATGNNTQTINLNYDITK